MGNSFVMMVLVGLLLTTVGLLPKRPLYICLGPATIPLAMRMTMTIYLLGNIFVMVGLGMNSFINFQGFEPLA